MMLTGSKKRGCRDHLHTWVTLNHLLSAFIALKVPVMLLRTLVL